MPRLLVMLLVCLLAGCADGVVGFGGYDDGDDGPAFDYDMGIYDPGPVDYGWWGGGEYLGGPPVYGYRGDGRYWHRGDDHPRGGGFGGFGRGPRPYRAAPPSRAIPSIPSHPRGGGFRGGGFHGGGSRGGGHR